MLSFCCSCHNIVDTFDTPICQNSAANLTKTNGVFFRRHRSIPLLQPATNHARKPPPYCVCRRPSLSLLKSKPKQQPTNQPTAKLSRSCSELAGSDFDGLGSGEKRRKKFSVLKSGEPNWDRVFCVFWFWFWPGRCFGVYFRQVPRPIAPPESGFRFSFLVVPNRRKRKSRRRAVLRLCVEKRGFFLR